MDAFDKYSTVSLRTASLLSVELWAQVGLMAMLLYNYTLMTEITVEPTKNLELRSHLTQVLTQEKYTSFFNLKPSQIKTWLEKLAINDDEIRFSPGYSSAGYGHNQSEGPQIEESDLGSAMSNYEHESRHGLHNLKCQSLFEDEDALQFVQEFKENVLGDIDFVKQIDKPGGSNLQEKMLSRVREIIAKDEVGVDEVKECTWMFGALTYQHAYFVDPGMCEAAASYGDYGVTLVIDNYNEWFAKLLIPGVQSLEGYSNPVWQDKFKNANDSKKALLVKSSDYDRNKFWS